MDVVNEGDVVGGVPVQAVAVQVEGDGVQHPVDGSHHVLAILTCRALGDGEAARDEVILHVHDNDGTPRLDDLK